MKKNLFLTLICSTLTLQGCMVGPDYSPPETPMPDEYAEDRNGENFVVNDEDMIHWWMIFNDPFLNELLEEAIQGSFDYRVALEQVAQARSTYWIQVAQILPEFDGDAQASHFRTSRAFASQANPAAAALSPIQNFFQCGFDAVWEIDLFGRLRRSAESAYDTWEASAETAQAVKITILSEVANTYVTICSLQQQAEIATNVVDLDNALLDLSTSRFTAGLTNEQEVKTAQAVLDADQASLKLITIALNQSIYSLSILLGRQPESLLNDFAVIRPIPSSTDRVPAGLPSDLLRRRPDIRSAERQLAAATEQIGIAVAALFPQVSLTGSSSSFAANPLQGANIGWSSDKIGKLLTPQSRIWGIGTLITFPVFDFGKRRAAIDVQVSLEEQAYLSYQKTVIAALQEVEQALTAYFNEEERLASLTSQSQAYQRNVELIADEYQAGLVDYTQVLEAQSTWLASLTTVTESHQALTSNLIAVYKALGGDW